MNNKVERRDFKGNPITLDFSQDKLLKEWGVSHDPKDWKKFYPRFEFGDLWRGVLRDFGNTHLVMVGSNDTSVDIPESFAVERRISEGEANFYLGISTFPDGLELPEPKEGTRWMLICFLRATNTSNDPLNRGLNTSFVSTQDLITNISSAWEHMLYAMETYQEVQRHRLQSE